MTITTFDFDVASKQGIRDLFCNHDVNGLEFVLAGKEYTIIDEEAGSKTRMCAPYYMTVFIVEDNNGKRSEMNICEQLTIFE
jgi:hypothetical protein